MAPLPGRQQEEKKSNDATQASGEMKMAMDEIRQASNTQEGSGGTPMGAENALSAARAAGGAVAERAESEKSQMGLGRAVFEVVGGVAKFSIGGALLAAVCIQLGSMGIEAYKNHQASGDIEKMRAEQKWLVGEGLAAERPIGVIYFGPFRDNDRAAYMASSKRLLGWETTKPVEMIDEKIVQPLLGKSMFSESLGIAPRTAQLNQNKEFRHTPERSYRHEEGHAQATANGRSVRAASAWTPEVARVASFAAARPDRNWRARWMAGVWHEAFGDAFSILSNARRGEAQYREEALTLHAIRALGSGTDVAGAVHWAGEIHSVDMASFMTAQLDVAKVAKLSSAGLDELAAKIADDSLAWAIARQGPLIGFFSPEGKEWWLAEAREAGAPAGASSLAWERWSKQASQIRPPEAFEDKKWLAGGESFEAKGLPKRIGFMARWRFDGYGGMAGNAGSVEMGKGGPMAKGTMVAISDKDGIAGGPQALEKSKDAIAMAAMGAAWTQWALAKALGSSEEREIKRVASLMGGKDPGFIADRFDIWTQFESVYQKQAELLGDVDGQERGPKTQSPEAVKSGGEGPASKRASSGAGM